MKFLVIQTRDIGDVMLSTALCNTLKLNHPDAHVDMLTMNYCTGVVEGNPNIDEIIVLERSQRGKIGYIWKLLRRIRARRYDVIINAQGQVTGLLICLFSLSSRRIGFDKSYWRIAHSDNAPPMDPAEHSGEGITMDDRMRLLAPLDLKQLDRRYRIWLSDAEQERGRELLRRGGIDPERPIVALGVNSRDDFKQWSLEYFAHIAQWLIESYGVQIYVFYGPGEEAYSKGLKALIGETYRGQVFDAVNTGSIRELAMVFAACDLYVGNDTGPRHIAQALDLPALAIVSPASNKYRWIPWNSPRFRAVDVGDAEGMSKQAWEDLRNTLTPGGTDQPWFRKLNVDFVKTRLKEMIDELGLFSDN